MNNQVLTEWPGGFSALLPQPRPYTAEDMESMRSMLQPRSNRLPQNVTARPRKAPLTDPSPQELSSRPLNIGVSEDVAERHFKPLRPGPAFGHSQTGLFGGYGRSFWKHVADVYDWERSMCANPINRPGLRDIATGIRLIIGDEFADHIFAPHGYLAENASLRLSDAERQAYARSLFMVTIYKAEGAPNQEEFVILLMKLPDRTVLSFGASARNGEAAKLLHKTAVDTLNRMVQENTLPQVIYNDRIPTTMRVTSGASWANPYLTLEAFRVFIRECRRQVIDYEDWTTAYPSIRGPERRVEAVRSNWLGDLRAALGHRVNLPFRIIPTNTANTRVTIPRQHQYTGGRYPVIAEEPVFQDNIPENDWPENNQDATFGPTSQPTYTRDNTSQSIQHLGSPPIQGIDQNYGNVASNTGVAADNAGSNLYVRRGYQSNIPGRPSSNMDLRASHSSAFRDTSGRNVQDSMWRDVARINNSPAIVSPSNASDTSGWGLRQYVPSNAASLNNSPAIGSPSNASDTSGWGLRQYVPSNAASLNNSPAIVSPSNASDTSGWGLPEHVPSNAGSGTGS